VPYASQEWPELVVENGKLDDNISNYLVALSDGFLLIHRGACFHVKPYSPYQFNRQFGFCQWMLEMLLKDPCSWAISYKDALHYWKRLLFFNSTSQGIVLGHTLRLL